MILGHLGHQSPSRESRTKIAEFAFPFYVPALYIISGHTLALHGALKDCEAKRARRLHIPTAFAFLAILDILVILRLAHDGIQPPTICSNFRMLRVACMFDAESPGLPHPKTFCILSPSGSS